MDSPLSNVQSLLVVENEERSRSEPPEEVEPDYWERLFFQELRLRPGWLKSQQDEQEERERELQKLVALGYKPRRHWGLRRG